jgi:hypothetical protein
MALLIRFDGSQREVIPADPNRGFTANEAANLIGCSKLEHAELADGRIMLMDEESKCRNDYIQRRNGHATTLYREAGAVPGDFVSGHVLICSSEEFR